MMRESQVEHSGACPPCEVFDKLSSVSSGVAGECWTIALELQQNSHQKLRSNFRGRRLLQGLSSMVTGESSKDVLAVSGCGVVKRCRTSASSQSAWGLGVPGCSVQESIVADSTSYSATSPKRTIRLLLYRPKHSSGFFGQDWFVCSSQHRCLFGAWLRDQHRFFEFSMVSRVSRVWDEIYGSGPSGPNELTGCEMMEPALKAMAPSTDLRIIQGLPGKWQKNPGERQGYPSRHT